MRRILPEPDGLQAGGAIPAPFDARTPGVVTMTSATRPHSTAARPVGRCRTTEVVMSRWILGVVAAGALAGAAAGADHTTDSLDTVKANVAAGKAVLVDVREADEWKDGHLKDARPLPLSEVKAGVPAEKL